MYCRFAHAHYDGHIVSKVANVYVLMKDAKKKTFGLCVGDAFARLKFQFNFMTFSLKFGRNVIKYVNDDDEEEGGEFAFHNSFKIVTLFLWKTTNERILCRITYWIPFFVFLFHPQRIPISSLCFSLKIYCIAVLHIHSVQSANEHSEIYKFLFLFTLNRINQLVFLDAYGFVLDIIENVQFKTNENSDEFAIILR